jgi:hypothetical protein
MAIVDAEAVVEDEVVENSDLERKQYWEDVMITVIEITWLITGIFASAGGLIILGRAIYYISRN